MLDIIVTGEYLIDLISENFVEDLADADLYRRIPGGSPANMGMNMARLGHKVALVASIGTDATGQFLYDYVKPYDLNLDGLARVEHPTTMVLVTRSQEVSDFEVYRFADLQIDQQQFKNIDPSAAKIFHTTCFGISKEPARSAILAAADTAFLANKQLSIDLNYAKKVWPNRDEAQSIVKEYVGKKAIVKISSVDWERLYGSSAENRHDEIIDFILDLGAKEVCLTLGGDGCWVANHEEREFLPTRPVDVKDTTGAGDAFWSGYLSAWLKEGALLEKAKSGRRMAELKLGHFGPLPRLVKLEGL